MPGSADRLRGGVALVTGGGHRIGGAISESLASNGCSVAIHYGSSEAAARSQITDVVSSQLGAAIASTEFNALISTDREQRRRGQRPVRAQEARQDQLVGRDSREHDEGAHEEEGALAGASRSM